MTSSQSLFYSDNLYEGSKYILTLYDDGSLHLISPVNNLIVTCDNSMISFKQLEDLKNIIWGRGDQEIFVKSPNCSKFYICDNREHYQIISEEEFLTKINNLKDNYKLFSTLEEANHYFREFNKFKLAQENLSYKLFAAYKEDLQKEFIDTYKNLYETIEEHHKEAQANGRKSLIIVGEEHEIENSFLIELIVINACTSLNINSLMIEDSTAPEFNLDTMLTNPQDQNKVELLSNILYQTDKWNIKPVDPLINVTDLHNQFTWQQYQTGEAYFYKIRAEYINNAISAVNENSLLIIGAAHLFDICNDPVLKSQYDILAINAVSPTLIQYFMQKYIDSVNSPAITAQQQKINTELEHELLTISEEDKALSKFQDCLEATRSFPLFLSANFSYLTSTEVLQIDNIITNFYIPFEEGVKMAINAIKNYNNANENSDQSRFVELLEGLFGNHDTNDKDQLLSKNVIDNDASVQEQEACVIGELSSEIVEESLQ
ncbi:MAG: hypothetical protein H6909_04115 [Rickettsiaceae bacterium]|nr:hypothetical protein [Rickettsiaceae bacterium]